MHLIEGGGNKTASFAQTQRTYLDDNLAPPIIPAQSLALLAAGLRASFRVHAIQDGLANFYILTALEATTLRTRKLDW